ncbi:MAG: hypothetical protein ACKVT1_12035 [Dehalococcoidia bacterium]
MNRSSTPTTGRIRHFEGQALVAPDLQDEADYETRLRGLHVRAMHNTWGVAIGFEVSRLSERLIHVGPGIAYDTSGGEIVSSLGPDIGPPVLPAGTGAAAWWFDLVVGPAETSNGPALASGCGGSTGTAAWRWCYAGPVRPGEPSPANVSPEARLGGEVPLVRCIVTDKRTFAEALDFSVRRKAQGLVRPHIAGGRVSVPLTVNQEQVALSATVATGYAGFNGTPFYFARVSIPAFLREAGGANSAAGFVGPFVTVRDPARTSFTLDVRFGAAQTGPGPILLIARSAATRALQATVDWTGIEPNGGCPPELAFFSGLFLFTSPLVSAGIAGVVPGITAILNEGSHHG